MKYPIGLLGGQSGSIDTQCTNHTFQLLHRLVLQCRLKRAKQRCYLIVCFQYLKDGLITLIKERKNVGHVRVFAKPICRFHLVPMLIKHLAGRFQPFGQRFFNLLRYQFLAVLVIRFTFIVHEEVDTGCQEVHRRCLEELVTATATFLLSFLQGFKEGFRRFTGCSQVVDVLLLNRIHPSAVFHIHKVDDIELASLRQITVLLVLQIVVVKLGCQCGELIVIYHHGKALGTVLTDKWFNDGESLT